MKWKILNHPTFSGIWHESSERSLYESMDLLAGGTLVDAILIPRKPVEIRIHITPAQSTRLFYEAMLTDKYAIEIPPFFWSYE